MKLVTTQVSWVRAGRLPDFNTMVSWVFFNREGPNTETSQHSILVIAELNVLTRTEGAARALIERTVLVECAIANGIPHY